MQVHQLIYMQHHLANGIDQVTMEAIIVSLSLAVLHVLLESFFLKMEAKATKTSFLHYCIICFNGRYGWVPFTDFMAEFNQ